MEIGYFFRKKYSFDRDYGGWLYIDKFCLFFVYGDMCIGVWGGFLVLFRCVELLGNEIIWVEGRNVGLIFDYYLILNLLFKMGCFD